jgi:hypothetical protein
MTKSKGRAAAVAVIYLVCSGCGSSTGQNAAGSGGASVSPVLAAGASANPGSGGSTVEFSAANQTITMQVQETKGFQDFLERKIGLFDFLTAGHYTLTVKPKVKPGLAVMDLRQVELVPEVK